MMCCMQWATAALHSLWRFALKYSAEHYIKSLLFGSSGAPLPHPSPTKLQGGAPTMLLTAPHSIFVGIPFGVPFLCTVHM
eukprot:4721568-Ditylum_brightwellii.AAC.1